MKTILVTGGAGYVGSHCCKAFAQAGWKVVVFDSLAHGWRDMVRWGPLIQGDLLDEAAVRRAVADTQPDVVAHFAGLISVAESVADPALYHRVNVTGSLNLLDALRGQGVKRMVFSSSAAVYGAPRTPLVREDHPLAPINPYGWTKLAIEQVLEQHDAAYGLKSLALRYFNAAGADPDGEIGERHEPETHVIPLALRGALEGGFAFTIHGDDFDTPDGTCVRDYVHVADLAQAHLAAAEHLMAGGGSDRINLGTGAGVSVAQIAQAIEKAVGRPLPRTVGPRRAGDPAVLVASNDRAREVLGWTPRRSTLAQIIGDALAWSRMDRARATA